MISQEAVEAKPVTLQENPSSIIYIIQSQEAGIPTLKQG